MTTRFLPRRLTLATALILSAASLVAFAAAPRERTEIQVVAGGKTEKIALEDLKVGETRQVYSEAGTLVTATRTAESLELDIGGEKTRLKMIEPDLDDPALAALLEAHGAGDGHTRVLRLHREHEDGAAGHAAHADGHRRVIVLKGEPGEHPDLEVLEALAGEHARVLIDSDAAGDGKRVVVKRTVIKDAGESK